MANLFILAPYPSHRLSVLLKHQSRHIKCAGILDYLARRGRMGDKPKFRPQTCAPNHGKSQNKLDVNIWNIARLRRLGEGDGAVDRNFECNLVFVDCVEARSVQLEASASEYGVFVLLKLRVEEIGYPAVGKHTTGRKSEVGPCSRS